MANEPEVILASKFTPEQVAEAEGLGIRIDSTLADIRHGEVSLSNNIAQLGSLLLQVRQTKYWELFGFVSFGKYINSVKERLDKGRTQIYHYIGVAQDLLPVVGEKALIEMGISKAIELRRVIKETGHNPSDAIVAKALNPATKLNELRSDIFEEYHVKPDTSGRYYELGAIYCSESEILEIETFFGMAWATDPVVSKDLPDWAKIKEGLLRMGRYYMSGHVELTKETQA